MKRTHWNTPLCPQDPEHGHLLDWPTATAGYYCPHVRHVGAAFMTTDLNPVLRSRSGDDGVPFSTRPPRSRTARPSQEGPALG